MKTRTSVAKVGFWGVLTAALVLAAGTVSAQVVGMATLAPGSVYHTQGTVLAKVVTQKTKLRMLVQPLGSGRATMTALNNGTAEFAWADVNDALFAVAGKGNYEGRGLPKVRLVANVRGVPVGVFARKDSGFTRVDQMRGKRFPSGYPAFPNGPPLMEGILAAAGMTYDDVVRVPTPSLVPGVNDFISGKMDVGFFAVGGPKVAEANSAVGGVRFLAIPNTPAALAAMRKVRPAYYIGVVKPAPPFAGVVEPTALMVFDQVLVAGVHVPDQMVAEVLDTMVKYKKDMVAGFKPFAGFIPAKMGKTYLWMKSHPGALKYFKEKGIKVGDE